MLLLPDSVRDRITPPVWRMRGLGQRGGLLLPLTPELRDGPSHPEEEETHPTPIKDAQTQRVGFGRQRCLTIV